MLGINDPSLSPQTVCVLVYVCVFGSICFLTLTIHSSEAADRDVPM